MTPTYPMDALALLNAIHLIGYGLTERSYTTSGCELARLSGIPLPDLLASLDALREAGRIEGYKARPLPRMTAYTIQY